METKNKIILFLIIIVLFASGLFYFWRAKTKQTIPKQTNENSSDFFPFDDGGNHDNGGTAHFSSDTQNGDIRDLTTNETNMPALRQISNNPVAGGIAFKTGDLVTVRYVERGTGHIVETTNESPESAKISNATIPKVSQAIWSPDGDSVIMRYTKDSDEIIYSFSASLIKATTSQDVSKNPKSFFLPSGITQLSMNPTGDKTFSLINSGNGAEGTLSSTNNSQKKQIFKSPVTEWLVSWPSKDIIALASKPSFFTEGYLFFLNSKTGEYNKILGGVNGLTALISSSTKNILYAESINESIKLNYYDLKNNDNNKIFSFKTLPEKCVWSKIDEFVVYCAVPKTLINADYPDDWYQGLVTFNDVLWKINTKTNSSQPVIDFQKENGDEFDFIEPFLVGEDEYLFFINKKDLTFWSLSLKEHQDKRADF